MEETHGFKYNDRERLAHLVNSGLLWYVNTMLHPFGMAVAVCFDEDTKEESGLALMSTDDEEGIVFADQQYQSGRQKFIDRFVVPE